MRYGTSDEAARARPAPRGEVRLSATAAEDQSSRRDGGGLRPLQLVIVFEHPRIVCDWI